MKSYLIGSILFISLFCCCASAETIYLVPQGEDDHVQINKALKYASNNPGTTIHLESGTYDIGDSLLIGSETTLDGERGTILKLAPNLPKWGSQFCDIEDEKAMLMIRGNYAHDITIRDIEIDGSQSDYYPNVRLGTSCYNMATLINCDFLNITNCNFYNGCNDALLISNCKYVQIDRIKVDKCGHDGVSAYGVEGIIVKNSKFVNRSNSSCRFYDVILGLFKLNKCTTSGGGYTGVELQGDLDTIHIVGNNFTNLPVEPIIQRDTGYVSNVVIDNNTIENCGEE